MELIYNSNGIAIGTILSPGEHCDCARVTKEIPAKYRTWCNDCIPNNNKHTN